MGFLPSLCVTHRSQERLGSHYLTVSTGLEALVFLWHLDKALQLSVTSVRTFAEPRERLNTKGEGSRCYGPLNLKLQM